MTLKVIDYKYEKHKHLDFWIDESKYENAKLINKFGLYNEPLSEIDQYFK